MATVAVAVAGLGLFGTGVRGLTQLDGQLATATKPPATQEVKQVDVRDDCPWENRRDERRL
ncbi:MAG: hypothetical protein QOD71_3221 [Thermoleophilaceae bacterium]|nr:hypothetical protein [Thermoleophilaceae bacterium]